MKPIGHVYKMGNASKLSAVLQYIEKAGFLIVGNMHTGGIFHPNAIYTKDEERVGRIFVVGDREIHTHNCPSLDALLEKYQS